MDAAVPVEDVQDVDTEPGQDHVTRFITNCLSSADILRPVLNNFSNNELLNLSLVNSLWNSEVRRVFKARGNLIATTQESNTCMDLADFAMGIKFMPIMPFSGMNIKLGGEHACPRYGLPAYEMDVICEEILDRINWRILAVQLDPRSGTDYQGCPGFLLLKKILDKFGAVLQELSLLVFDSHEDFFHKGLDRELQYYNFPHLKTLKLQDVGINVTTTREYTRFIKTMITRAPNLQTLYTRDMVQLSANLLEGSAAVHLTDYPYSPALREIPKRAVSSLRLKKMKLLGIGGNLTAELFSKTTSAVLQASLTTLAWMNVDAPFLVPLMTYGVSLKNLRTLKINFDYSREFAKSKPDVWNCLESFDFTRTFPNLYTVQIHGDSQCSERLQRVLNVFIGIVDEGEGNPTPDDRAVNIRSLKLEWHSVLSRDYIKTFAKMFPNIKRLSIRADGILPLNDFIYGSWLDLEELEISIKGVKHCLNLNLDTDFCGIFPEEVAQLRQQDDEYLERVNIVPVKPCIPSLKSLETLKIALEWESKLGLEPPELSFQNALFSKVTPLVAFKKCPNLNLNLIADDERVQKVLTDLGPYLPDILGCLT